MTCFLCVQIVSCSGAGSIYYTQVDREDMHGKCLFDCHTGTTYEVRALGEVRELREVRELGEVR